MPRIYVEFNQMKQLSSDCQKISSRVGAIQSDFQRIVRQICISPQRMKHVPRARPIRKPALQF